MQRIEEQENGSQRHVSGQELLEGFRDYALAHFGPMAATVLKEWGLRNGKNVGEMGFRLLPGLGFGSGSSGFARPVSYTHLWNRSQEGSAARCVCRASSGIRWNAPGHRILLDVYKRQDIAIREAHRLNIPVCVLVDTNADPKEIDFPTVSYTHLDVYKRQPYGRRPVFCPESRRQPS